MNMRRFVAMPRRSAQFRSSKPTKADPACFGPCLPQWGGEGLHTQEKTALLLVGPRQKGE